MVFVAEVISGKISNVYPPPLFGDSLPDPRRSARCVFFYSENEKCSRLPIPQKCLTTDDVSWQIGFHTNRLCLRYNNNNNNIWTYPPTKWCSRRIITPAHKAHTSFLKPSQLPGEYTAQLLPLQRIGPGLINQLCPHRYPFNPWVERSNYD